MWSRACLCDQQEIFGPSASAHLNSSGLCTVHRAKTGVSVRCLHLHSYMKAKKSDRINASDCPSFVWPQKKIDCLMHTAAYVRSHSFGTSAFVRISCHLRPGIQSALLPVTPLHSLRRTAIYTINLKSHPGIERLNKWLSVKNSHRSKNAIYAGFKYIF